MGMGVCEDRISSLPDDIRGHILSLVPIKCSASTSVLSRNWRYVWRYVQTIHLEDSDLMLRYSDRTTFQSVVNQLLVYNQSVVIPNIYLHTQFDVDLFTLNSWIRAAVSRQVGQLDISIPTSIPYDMIITLSSCPTLEVLKIDGKVVDHHGDYNLCFPLLKVLHLRKMSPKAMQRLYTASCPLLQELVLDGMLIFEDNTTNYLISIPTLKSLTVRFRSFNCRGISVQQKRTFSFDFQFFISTPAIESLDIVGPNLLYKFLVDMPFLRKATLDLEFSPKASVFTRFVELLNAMPNIHALCLSPTTVSLLGFLYNDVNLPTFHKLTHLEVQILDYFEPQLVINFIKSLPKLHSFVLMKEVVDKHALAASTSLYYRPESVPYSAVSLVNIIEIQGFNGPKDEQLIMTYLLEHAEVEEEEFMLSSDSKLY